MKSLYAFADTKVSPSLPILGCFAFTPNGVLATDLASVACFKPIKTKAGFCVNAKKYKDVTGFDDFKVTGKGQFAKGSKTVFLEVTDLDEFPSLPEKGELLGEVDAKELKEALRAVMPARGVEDSRPILEALHLTPRYVEAADGFRSAHHKLAWVNKDVLLDGNWKALVAVLKRGVVRVFDNDDYLIFELENWAVAMRITEGSYPNLSNIIPKKFLHQVAFETAVFKKALKSKGHAALRFEGRKVTLEDLDEAGKVVAETELPVCQLAHQLKTRIGFNTKYVSDVLQAIKGDRVRLRWNSANEPLEFRDLDNLHNVYMVMPIRNSENS